MAGALVLCACASQETTADVSESSDESETAIEDSAESSADVEVDDSNAGEAATATPLNDGAFVSGASHLCLLSETGTPICWGSSGADGTPTDSTFVSLAAGGRQSVGLAVDGSIECWGDNADLCPDTTLTLVEPGYFHTCGLVDVGTPVCWGDEAEADPNLFFPPDQAFVELTSGWFHTCGLTTEGSVTCWGEDADGLLDPPEGVTFTEISAGRDFTCGLDTEQNIRCWGEPGNDQGQAQDMTGPFTQVSSGFYHSCGITTAGELVCQGRNFTEATGPVTEPVDPTNAPDGSYLLLPAKMGYAHGCAINVDTALVDCWGADYGGQVSGAPADEVTWLTATATSAATTESASESATAASPVIAAGARHTCALTTDDEIACWGREVMNGTYPLVSSDVYVGQTFTAALRGTHQGIGLLEDRSILCWGEDDVDQCQDRPGPYIDVSGADKHACGILVGGTLECWGDSESLDVNQTFDGTYVQVASGYFHTCALDESGQVSCWGCLSSDAGQCDTSNVDQLTFTQITSGREYTCGLTSEGAAHCWGENGEGQAPETLDGPYSTLGAGSFHGCAVRADNGAVECWGRNDDGQATPPAGEFSHVVGGFTFSCGLLTDGSATCWGEDAEGFIDPPDVTFAVNLGQ